MPGRPFSTPRSAPPLSPRRRPAGGHACAVILVGWVAALLGYGAHLTGASAQTLSPGAASTSAAAEVPATAAATGSPSDVMPVRPRTNVGLPGTLPTAAGSVRPTALPRVFAPSRPRHTYTRYPWRLNIMSTVFWIGERPTVNNPTPNDKSSWDINWVTSYGGYDDPDPGNRSANFHPKGFIPGQNPFYIALPYNDVQSGTYRTKVEARQIIPWFHRKFKQTGHTVLKGRWLAIRRGGKVCYGQWEDVGPFETDDWRYVFGEARPRTTGNRGAGLDVSPAIRDFLNFNSGHAVCDWRFVDVQEVPDGPWKNFGDNNDFVQMRQAARKAEEQALYEDMDLLKAKRNAALQN